MKTQLLEDIGQNATSSPTPSRTAGHSKAEKEVQHLAPAGNAQPAGPRSASGVWRQKPPGEPQVSMAQHSEEPASLELNKVFEEIAALEAQFLPPGQQHEPGVAPAESGHAFPASPAGSLHKPDIPLDEFLHKPAIPAAEATPGPNPPPSAAAPQEPRFDFTPPPPGRQANDPFTPAPTGLARSRQRYLLWAIGLLSVALLIQGGRWLYQERNDARSLALIAGEAKEGPRGDGAVKQGALAAKGAALEPEGDARVPSAMPASRPSPAVPPLVLLEPEPAGKPEQPPPSVTDQAGPPVAPQPELVAKQEPASPAPKPSSRKARASSEAAARPAKEKAKREPVRQLARASATGKESPSARDSSLAATLKACREHGYHATQCIKQDCRVTQYGFACRGR